MARILFFFLLLCTLSLSSQNMDKAPIDYATAELYMHAKCKSTKLKKIEAPTGSFKIDYPAIAKIFNPNIPNNRKRFRAVTYRRDKDKLIFVGRGFSINKAPVILEGKTGEYYAFFWTSDNDRVMARVIVKQQGGGVVAEGNLFDCK